MILDSKFRVQGLVLKMDFISSFDIHLEKDVYYSGETITGTVNIENVEPIKVRGE